MSTKTTGTYALDESRLDLSDRNISWTDAAIDRKRRQKQNKHRSSIIWLTGLSGSGKTTLARELEKILFQRGYQVAVLDGDNIRHGLNSDLGFSIEDRAENIRRVGEVAKLMMNSGLITIAAFISPYCGDRDRIRNIVDDGDFIEVYLRCPVTECERRDVKGLYKKARAGLIKNFTGIDDPYEEPLNAEIVIDTENMTVKKSVDKILQYLANGGYL